MKYLSRITIPVLILVSTTLSQVSLRGLVDIFPFNGNYQDLLENLVMDLGNTREPLISPDHFQRINQAYHFDGTYQALRALNTSSLPSGTDDFTVSAWIRVGHKNAPQTIVSWGTDTAGQTKEFAFFARTPSLACKLGITNGVDSLCCNITPVTVLANWSHVAVTVNAGTVKIFLNSNKMLEQAFPLNIQPNGIFGLATDWLTERTRINGLAGDLDDIFIYNRALSDSEIVYLYTCKPIINNPPRILSRANTTATVSENYIYDVITEDIDEHVVTLSLTKNPDGMTLSGNRISWVPTSAQIGADTVLITATDILGAYDVQEIVINVQESIATSPIITSSPDTTAEAGTPYSYTVTAVKKSELILAKRAAITDNITFSLPIKPTGMSITQGVISWTPTNNQSGINIVRVVAKDIAGDSTEQTFHITVVPTTKIAPVTVHTRIITNKAPAYYLPNGMLCKGPLTAKGLYLSNGTKRIIVK